ncbi:uncharacterized protein LOC114574889 [Exaiptasia diaphana]|uniref:Uncharacterized protein n=1 Tax=Exaiptasia diaphana TaxID=2652724 RepID=A0A913YIK8_EXADI|nr:uncharacterized protein LOC114574889 [Exaiptasia diaphana]
MYVECTNALPPSTVKIAPVKSASGDIITDGGKQMERWAEQYQQLYSWESIVTIAAESINLLPVMDELYDPPSLEKLSKAIDTLVNGKAPDSHGIPPEVITTASVLGGRVVGPRDMRDANITTLYKKKRESSDCNNYRGISLLSIVGKVFASSKDDSLMRDSVRYDGSSSERRLT